MNLIMYFSSGWCHLLCHEPQGTLFSKTLSL